MSLLCCFVVQVTYQGMACLWQLAVYNVTVGCQGELSWWVTRKCTFREGSVSHGKDIINRTAFSLFKLTLAADIIDSCDHPWNRPLLQINGSIGECPLNVD